MDNIDVALRTDDNGLYDIVVDVPTGDFVGVKGLETAFQLSAFAERRADVSEVAQPELRRGWVGNLVGPRAEEGFEIGSKLWLLEQSRSNQGAVNFGSDALKNALQWLIDEDIVQTITVTGNRKGSAITLKAVLISSESETETVLFNLLEETVSGAAITRL